ncbi:hypothetical protein [Portibacter marinus]|uniref:hypothetical protein n=1 Tax=Portibacter marinus TaxID=2898660 RepID=UPI001F1C7F2E|nr:hypothetical protein [Portibacter marinus]
MAKNIEAQFEFGKFYHVFNRTNNSEILFREEMNRYYFIKLCKEKLKGIIDVYAIALLRNHFHFAIKIRSEEGIVNYLNSIDIKKLTTTQHQFLEKLGEDGIVHRLISGQFSKVFNSYSQAFNKKYKREGHLFHAPYKRSMIYSDNHLSQLICYIHFNSVNHGVVKNLTEDRWSTYPYLLKDRGAKHIFRGFVNADAVLDHFVSKRGLVDFYLKYKNEIIDYKEAVF